MNTGLIFSLANALYLVGTIFLIGRVVKNRNSLKDFNPYGSLINFIGMVVNSIALISLSFYVTVIISIPTMLFWLIAAVYSFWSKNYDAQ